MGGGGEGRGVVCNFERDSVAAFDAALDLLRARQFSLSDLAPRRSSFLRVALTWAAAPGAAPQPVSCATQAVGLDFILLS